MPAITLSELARLCEAELVGDGERVVHGPAGLAEAGEDEVSFLANPRYRSLLAETRAAAVVVGRDVEEAPPGVALLRCEDPNEAFSRVIEAFVEPDPVPAVGLHPSCVVEPDAVIEEGARVGPFCRIGAGAWIGEGAVLAASVDVGPRARIGRRTVVGSGAVIGARVVVGERCVLQPGCVIGSDGFGFDPTPEGWKKVPQCGTVVLEDEVEVGANTTIDRARFGATRIGRGAKIDNLVHVAHNCVVEEGAMLCAQVGLAGSARVGRRAILAGQVGVQGHSTIGEGARVGGQAGVFGDVPPRTDVAGWPARPRAEALRQVAWVRRLPELFRRLRELELRVADEEATNRRERADA